MYKTICKKPLEVILERYIIKIYDENICRDDGPSTSVDIEIAKLNTIFAILIGTIFESVCAHLNEDKIQTIEKNIMRRPAYFTTL